MKRFIALGAATIAAALIIGAALASAVDICPPGGASGFTWARRILSRANASPDRAVTHKKHAK